MILAGIIALFTALSFAELAAWKPVEGSVYQYTRTLVSPFAGFLTGWMWIVSNTFGGATVALGFAYYLGSAFPGLPLNLVAAAICLGFTALNFVGIRQSSWLNNVLVVINIAVLAFFVVFGVLHFNGANFLPFLPLNSGMFYGAFFIFFAYGGFARVAVIAEEVKDAKRNVPKAIISSLAISMTIYVLVGVVAVGLVGAGVLASSNSPLSSAIGVTGSSLAIQIISIGGLVATAGVLLTSVLGVSMSRVLNGQRKRHAKRNVQSSRKIRHSILFYLDSGRVDGIDGSFRRFAAGCSCEHFRPVILLLVC